MAEYAQLARGEEQRVGEGVTTPTNRIDLAKEFSAGKITVNQFMAELTREGTPEGEVYKKLCEGVQARHIKYIVLVKNDNGTYEFKGVLSDAGKEKQKMQEMHAKRKKFEGTTYGVASSSNLSTFEEAKALAGISDGSSTEQLAYLNPSITIGDSLFARISRILHRNVEYIVTETGYKEFTLEERRLVFKDRKYRGDDTLGKKS